jgi:hypothetical protein
MKATALKILTFSGLSLLLVCCGDIKETSTTVYGNLTFNNTGSNDATLTTLTKIVTCKRDADLGIFDFEATTDDGRSALKFRVKGFKSTMETYSCKQADDNRSGTSLGGKYDNCYVYTKVSSPTGLNGYSMYREEAEKAQSFTYGGSCQIQFSEVSPKAKAKIICTKMIQTMLNGSTRNPVSDSVTGDVSAEVDCPI